MEIKQKVACSYEISSMNFYDLYDVLCRELTFDNMINLYRLIKNKVETLEDELRPTACICIDKND